MFQEKVKIHDPSRRWTKQTLWRRSITQFEEKIKDIFCESEGPAPPPPEYSLLDACEAINDFLFLSGNFKNRHEVKPRFKLYASSPFVFKYIDASRTVHTNWDIAREAHRWALEHWWFSRLVWSLDRFHTINSTRRKSSWRIYLVREKINEKTAYTQARSSMARAL